MNLLFLQFLLSFGTELIIYLALIILIVFFMIGTLLDLIIKIKIYLRKQRRVNFVNKNLITDHILSNNLNKNVTNAANNETIIVTAQSAQTI